MAGTLALLSFSTFLDSKLSPSPGPKQWLQTLIFLFAAGLCKLSYAALILGYLWLDVVPRPAAPFPIKKLLLRYLLPIGLALLAVLLLQTVVPYARITQTPPLSWRILGSLEMLGTYLFKVLVPSDYYFDYGLTPTRFRILFAVAPMAHATFAALGLGIILAFLSSFRTPKPGLFHLFFGLFFVLQLPFLGLIPFVYQNISMVADRYLYLSSLVYALFLAWLWLHVPKPLTPLRVRVALCLWVLCSGMLAFHHVEKWRTSETLLTYTLERNPFSFAAHEALGSYLRTKGREKEAHFHFASAISIRGMELELEKTLRAPKP